MTCRASFPILIAACAILVPALSSEHLAAGQSAGTKALMTPESLTEQAPPEFKVNLDTSKGAVVIQVHRDWAPNATDRFYNLVKNGYYNENRFFRVVPGFLVQFGIHPDPEVWGKWRTFGMKEDPPTSQTKRYMKPGYVAFTSAGLNRKNPQVFISLEDDKVNRWGIQVAPFGEITSGMNLVERVYAGYGDMAPGGNGPSLNGLQMEGNAYLIKEFPQLDYIKTATIQK